MTAFMPAAAALGAAKRAGISSRGGWADGGEESAMGETWRSPAVFQSLPRIGEKRVERVYSIPVDGGRRASVVLYGGRSLFENVRTENLRVEVSKTDAGDDVPRVILPPSLDGKVEVRSVKLRG